MNVEYTNEIDLTNENEVSHWQSINDGVMGGESQGWLTYCANASVFTGNISLENNGGFSSIKRTIEQLPAGLDLVDIDVAGDGLTYQLKMAIFVNGYRLAYKHDFTTTLGKRECIQLKLSDFKASFRGRYVEGAPELSSANIIESGFLLTHNTACSFKLTLFKIKFYKMA